MIIFSNSNFKFYVKLLLKILKTFYQNFFYIIDIFQVHTSLKQIIKCQSSPFEQVDFESMFS